MARRYLGPVGSWRRSICLAVAAAASALVAPVSAYGTVTVGSNLDRAPNSPHLCGMAQCTLIQETLPATATASGGLIARVNGTVVTWRVRVGATTGPVSLRVIRRLGGNLFAGVGTSTPVTPPANATSAYPTQLPIAIGETIGFNCCTGNQVVEVIAPGTAPVWFPALADGGSGRPPDNTFPNTELALNADIEPTSAFTILKAKSKPGGKVRITAQVPNPGLFAAGNKSAKVAGTAAGRKKTKYLKGIDTRVSAPGPAVLVVQSTKAARSVLADKGRLKAKLKLSFTPTGGAASTQVRKVKLKL
jgi:hypothetical protein